MVVWVPYRGYIGVIYGLGYALWGLKRGKLLADDSVASKC